MVLTMPPMSGIQGGQTYQGTYYRNAAFREAIWRHPPGPGGPAASVGGPQVPPNNGGPFFLLAQSDSF